MTQSSEFLTIDDQKIHLRRIDGGMGPDRTLLIHGSIENGRIFYTESGKGFGPHLARSLGTVVTCVDLRGRGKSEPHCSTPSDSSQNQLICRDLPLLIQTEFQKNSERPIWLGAHSWGGVLVWSTLVRFPELIDQVSGVILFATKRSITVQNLEKWLKIDLGWNRLLPWLARKRGYLAARKIGFGADDEPLTFLLDSVQWVKPGPWIDPSDGFHYQNAARALAKTRLPPSLWLTGVQDSFLGHPRDVQHFMSELGIETRALQILGRAFGDRRNYGHIDLLTHADAEADHFPRIVSWMRQFNRLNPSKLEDTHSKGAV